MIVLDNITKKYGRQTALDGLTMRVGDGMLYGLVGQNGAGKTTAMKIMLGLEYPDSGSVTVGGYDVGAEPGKIHGLVGYVPDSFGIYGNLTVAEYMDFFASAYGLKGLSKRKRYEELLGQVGLDDRQDAYVDTLSRGMQQRLCLARALIHDPQILIMDEPSSGLDPRSRFEFREILTELHSQGKTLLISSHNLTELSQICTDLGIIDKGRLILSGSMDSIMDTIENSNPIRVGILDGEADALMIFRRDPCVRSVTQSGHEFSLRFEGSREDEAALLQRLIDADIPVREFGREPGSLESYFMQITDHVEERVIMSDEF